jgi:hypothetical protein
MISLELEIPADLNHTLTTTLFPAIPEFQISHVEHPRSFELVGITTDLIHISMLYIFVNVLHVS